MASSTKWRIYVTDNNNAGAGYVTAVNLEFRTSIGGGQAATGGTAIFSTQNSNGVPLNYAASAFDSNDATEWVSEDATTPPQWVGYEWPSPVTILEIALKGSFVGQTQYCPKDFTVDYWDGAAWVTVDTIIGEIGWAGLEERIFTLPAIGEANTSDLVAGTLRLNGSVLTAVAASDNISDIVSGSLRLKGSILQASSPDILGSDSLGVTIQETVDLYYLTDVFDDYAVDYWPPHVSAISLDLVGGVLTKTGLRATATRAILSADTADLSYVTDFYNRIHFSVKRLDLGNILSIQIFDVDIWNAYFVNTSLDTLTPVNLADVTFEFPHTIPHTFKPLENITSTITADSVGTPMIDGYYSFIFGIYTYYLYVTGQRVVLFPFAPLAQFTETRQWLTDILPARAGETRYAMRDVARTTYAHTYQFLDEQSFVAARLMAKDLANLALGFPAWTDVSRAFDLVATTDTIYFDTTYLELAVGDPIVIWESYDNFELAEILTITDDYITTRNPLIASRAACWVAPVKVMYTDGIHFSQGDNHSIRGNITATGVKTYTASEWPDAILYNGLPVLPVAQIVTGGLTSKFTRLQSGFDTETGYISKLDIENYNRHGHTLQIKSQNREELYKMRRQFDYFRGKYSSFWLPSFGKDMTALEDIPLGSDSLHINSENFNSHLPDYIRITGDDTVQYFAITAISDNLDGTSYIVLDHTASPAITNITRIEILYKMRLDSDSIEFAHSHSTPQDGKRRFFTMTKAPLLEVIA